MTECKCTTQFCKHRKAQVWSCGGGTQSCAIAALICAGRLPKPDFSVIADTGYETGATWEYMDATLVPNLRKVGVELVRISKEEFGYAWGKGLFANAKTTKGPMMPIFSTESDNGKAKNLCSKGWKTEVVNNWLSRVHKVTELRRVKWIGFSRDEQLRIVKMQRTEEYAKGLIRFPLLEVGLTRRDCIKLVESMGWPTPPRSSCYMCPNHSDHEWRKLIKERPEEFKKAVELEREIHKVDPDAWLHRSCIPLDQVDFSQPEDLFSRPCDSGMCYV